MTKPLVMGILKGLPKKPRVHNLLGENKYLIWRKEDGQEQYT